MRPLVFSPIDTPTAKGLWISLEGAGPTDGLMLDRITASALANKISRWIDATADNAEPPCVDHDDALALASSRQAHSNLARCYLELRDVIERNEPAAAKAILERKT